MLHRRIKVQLAVLTTIGLVAMSYMSVHFIQLPAMLFGVGRYTVTMELSKTGGLYESGNVTYRGTKVGRVHSVRLTDSGVEARLSLKSGIEIPSDLKAEVHSQSAIGEQYVDLRPRSGSAPPLKDGDVIQLQDTSVPPDINTLLAATNTALRAIPRDNLKTAIDEAAVAVGGLGPELSRLVRGSSDLAIDARENLDSLVSLIDQWQPVADSQIHTSDKIQAWASHVANVASQLQTQDEDVAGILDKGAPALGEAQELVERLRPGLPTLMSNMVDIGRVALDYRNNIEQLLVVIPEGISVMSGSLVANHNTKQPYRGAFLSFNLNINLPPPCTTGFLPAQQRRVPSFVDYPERTSDNLYCRVPQDSTFHVRGVRNTECATVPGKRAPTVRMCESDEEYVPLNEGFNWKGDPNATYTGQDIPQPSPESKVNSSAVPLPIGEFDPATGAYVGADGQQHEQDDLTPIESKEKTWESMLTPPTEE